MSLAVTDHCTEAEQLVATSKEEKKQNCDLIKKHIRSLYFLGKHHLFHTRLHLSLLLHMKLCPQNAIYESYTTVVDLIANINKLLKEKIYKGQPIFLSYGR